jgi:RNA polymerase sigma factor (sigma-70 family)
MANENQKAMDAIDACFTRKGDGASLKLFHDAFHGVIKTFLMTISNGDWDLVDDVYQEVFVKCVDMFRQGRSPGREYRPAYFVAMAKNRFIDELRKRKKIVSGDSLFAELIPGIDAKSAVSEEDKITLQMALLQLKPRDRYILEKHYFEGWSNEKLAAYLGVKPASIPMMIKRAREKLRKIMSGC